MKATGKLMLILLFSAILIILNSSLINQWVITTKQEAKKQKCPDGHIITVINGGKLANNIWEYMSLFSVTYLYTDKLKLIAHCPELLKAKIEYVFERLSIPSTSEIPRSCFTAQEPYVLELNRSLNFDMGATNYRRPLALAKYSARYTDIIKYGLHKIKDELRFRQEYVKYSYKVFDKIKSTLKIDQDVTFVGMHYRGTDYIDLLKRNYKLFNGPPTYSFYLRAMNYFKKKYQVVVFILITIDFSWLKENLPYLKQNNYLIVNPIRKGNAKDLALLSHCNHSIINYGTFGTTSALFAEGTTFVYDLGIPLDQRGPTVAMGIAGVLPNWHMLT